MRSYVMPAIICLLIVILTSSTSSAYYKYTTADGTVCFVDSIEMVPPRYRSKAIETGYARERSDEMSKQIGRSTSAIRESGSHKVQDSSETSSNGFRWNFGMLVLLAVLGFFIARRIEQRGLFKHASRFRCITLFLVVVLAYFFNRDIVDECTEAIRLKVAATRKSIAEQREKDRKPLKPLSERVEELMQQPNP
jgi:hypothetical protein